MDISITQKKERRFLRQYANFGLFSSPPFVVTGVPAAREVSRKEMSLHFLWRILCGHHHQHSFNVSITSCLHCTHVLALYFISNISKSYAFESQFLTHFYQGCELGHLNSDREKMLKILKRVRARWQPSFS